MRIINELRKNALVVVFLTFICLSMFDYCVSVYFDVIEKTQTPYEKTEYTEEFMEFQKEQLTNSNNNINQSDTIIDKYLDIYINATNSASNYSNLLIKDNLLKLNAWACKTAGMSYIAGTTFLKLDDGMLVSLNQNGTFEEEQMQTQVEYLKNFTEKLKDRDINYMYVDCPNKSRLLNEVLPIGFQNSAEYNENKYMYKLFLEKDIPILNLTEKMIKSDDDIFDMFYKTNHHWKTEYGIEGAKYISDYLNSEFNYEIDTRVFNKTNYFVKKYENCLLGSTGINSTDSFVEPEDFEVFLSKEKTEFSFEIPSKNIDSDGDFNVFFNYESLNRKAKWPFNAYASYIYANSAYVKIENRSINDNHKILIIKDSFANAIVPYLSQVVRRVDVVDVRKSQTDHFNSSLISLIDENDYDTVLFIYNDFSYEVDRLHLR